MLSGCWMMRWWNFGLFPLLLGIIGKDKCTLETGYYKWVKYSAIWLVRQWIIFDGKGKLKRHMSRSEGVLPCRNFVFVYGVGAAYIYSRLRLISFMWYMARWKIQMRFHYVMWGPIQRWCWKQRKERCFFILAVMHWLARIRPVWKIDEEMIARPNMFFHFP